MSHTYDVEYMDTFAGEVNCSWVRRHQITVPEWPAFKGFDGNGRREPKGYQRAVMRAAKKAADLTGVRGRTESQGDSYTFRPYGMCTVLFVTYREVQP